VARIHRPVRTISARLTPILLLPLAAGLLHASGRRQLKWQADIQIRTLEITRSRTGMSLRVVVYTENDDEARDAKVLILLPVAVGIEKLGPGCTATAGPSMMPSLRATVACDLGAIADRAFREVLLTTTLPPDESPRRFGVFAYSATPDPRPGNNYAERIIP
jgi:hypothetical protein